MPTLESIRRKVEAGERLSLDDGLFLYEPTTPLHEVGELANLVRERKNGNRAYYNINTHLNATNVCVYRCTFCAFRSDLREAKGYVMSDEQILARGQEAVDNGCTEMHIVGGLHHQKKYDWYVNLVRILHDAYPELHLKAWTGVEINWFEFLAKKTRPRDPGRPDRGRPGQHARRRGGDFSSRSPRQNLRAQGRRRQVARHPPHGPPARPARPTARCSTATSRTPITASTT